MNQRVSIPERQAKGVTQASLLAQSDIDTGRYASMDKNVCRDKSISSPFGRGITSHYQQLGSLLHLLQNSVYRLAAPLVTGVTGVAVPFELVAGVNVVFDASPGNTSP